MLEIKPIQTKEEQAAACARCKIEYDPGCMAYSAKLDGEFIGMAQFTIEAKRGRIRNIVTVEGVDDFEALFLMGRAALNFIDLCGIHTAVCDETAATPRVITAVGFKRAENGSLLADMTHMFGGCEDKH